MEKKPEGKTPRTKSLQSSQKGKLKTSQSVKGSSASSHKGKSQTISIPLGSAPSMFDSERFHQLISKLISESGLTDINEINAYLEKNIMGKPLDDLLGIEEEDSTFQAQELAYQAMEAGSAKKALALAQKALVLDPFCVDALMQVALITAKSAAQQIQNVHEVLTKTESHLGQDYFEENRGHFWGLTETRPYMRALQTYGELLRTSGRHREAISICERMLDLNPGDNQGIRDILLGLYLQTGDLEGARRLLEAYDDSFFAVFLWGRVLERFLSGDMATAAKAYKEAKKANHFVVEYLTGQKRMPKQEVGYYSLGDENEAVHCIDMIGMAWVKAPGALEWLSKRR